MTYTTELVPRPDGGGRSKGDLEWVELQGLLLASHPECLAVSGGPPEISPDPARTAPDAHWVTGEARYMRLQVSALYWAEVLDHLVSRGGVGR